MERPGIANVQAVFEPNEPIVSLITYKDMVLVATTKRVYRASVIDCTDTLVFEPVVFHEDVVD